MRGKVQLSGSQAEGLLEEPPTGGGGERAPGTKRLKAWSPRSIVWNDCWKRWGRAHGRTGEEVRDHVCRG